MQDELKSEVLEAMQFEDKQRVKNVLMVRYREIADAERRLQSMKEAVAKIEATIAAGDLHLVF